MIFRILIAFVLFLKVYTGISQDFQGKIVFIKRVIDSSGAVINEALTDTVTEYISKGKIRIDQMSGIGKQISIFNSNDSSFVLLIDIYGTKLAISMPKEFINSKDTIQQLIKKRCKKKKVADYKCNYAKIIYTDSSIIEVYYTNKIPAELNYKIDGLNGYPLEYSLIFDDGIQHQKAFLIEESELNEQLFKIPEDYTQMSYKEFMELISN